MSIDLQQIVRALALLALTSAGPLACAHPSGGAVPAVEISPSDVVLADSAEVKRVAGSMPRYPHSMQEAAIEAKLVAVYVVDTSGRPNVGSVRFLLDTKREFRLAICDALHGSRFAPIQRDGRARPALFIDPYGFFIGEDTTRWAKDKPDVDALRAAIRSIGVPAALAQLAQRPGCR